MDMQFSSALRDCRVPNVMLPFGGQQSPVVWPRVLILEGWGASYGVRILKSLPRVRIQFYRCCKPDLPVLR